MLKSSTSQNPIVLRSCDLESSGSGADAVIVYPVFLVGIDVVFEIIMETVGWDSPDSRKKSSMPTKSDLESLVPAPSVPFKSKSILMGESFCTIEQARLSRLVHLPSMKTAHD